MRLIFTEYLLDHIVYDQFLSIIRQPDWLTGMKLIEQQWRSCCVCQHLHQIDGTELFDSSAWFFWPRTVQKLELFHKAQILASSVDRAQSVREYTVT